MVRFLWAAWAEIAGKRSWHECLKRGHWKILCGLTRQASPVWFKISLASALDHERVNAEPARMLCVVQGRGVRTSARDELKYRLAVPVVGEDFVRFGAIPWVNWRKTDLSCRLVSASARE